MGRAIKTLMIALVILSQQYGNFSPRSSTRR
jgi:hypothetical protein